MICCFGCLVNFKPWKNWKLKWDVAQFYDLALISDYITKVEPCIFVDHAPMKQTFVIRQFAAGKDIDLDSGKIISLGTRIQNVRSMRYPGELVCWLMIKVNSWWLHHQHFMIMPGKLTGSFFNRNKCKIIARITIKALRKRELFQLANFSRFNGGVRKTYNSIHDRFIQDNWLSCRILTILLLTCCY